MEKEKLRWSLEDLYSSFDDPAYVKDEQSCQDTIQDLNQWTLDHLNSQDQAAEKITAYLEKTMVVNQLYLKLAAFASLTQSADAKNNRAVQALGRLQSKYTEQTKGQVRFLKWLSQVEEIDQVIQTSSFLQAHQFHLKESLEKAHYLLSDEEELAISKLTMSGSKAWANLQQHLTATLLVEIEIEGEKKSLPLQVVRNMAYEGDQNLRKAAFEAELAAYPKIVASSAAALNGIKGECITVGKLRGFASPLDETLFQSRMSQKTLEAMMEAIKESLPAFRKFYRQKATLLGHENGLPFYDLFAPMGAIHRTYTFEEAIAYVIENFNRFSPKLGDFAKKAYENQWIDVEPREGKRGGAFCSNLHPIKQSRFLLNFTGSLNNVTTLAHELGHGYHGECLQSESLHNSSYPMPLAETASIFAETILVRDVMEKGSEEEQFWVLENSISHAGQVIVDIYSRYLFESEVFRRREIQTLSVDEINEIMVAAQKEAYGEGLDHDVLHPFMWVNKSHYFFPERHFYNFPYAFGQLFAKGLFAQYLQQPEGFPEKYEALLRATGKMSVEEVAETVELDLTEQSFWKTSLKLLEEEIEQFIELSQQKEK